MPRLKTAGDSDPKELVVNGDFEALEQSRPALISGSASGGWHVYAPDGPGYVSPGSRPSVAFFPEPQRSCCAQTCQNLQNVHTLSRGVEDCAVTSKSYVSCAIDRLSLLAAFSNDSTDTILQCCPG